ncbi:MAG: type II secretion system F family protein [Candidatus Hodarchaeales archaeon]
MSKAFRRISYITFGKFFEERINEGKFRDFDKTLKQSGYEGSLRLYLGMLVFGYVIATAIMFIVYLVAVLILAADNANVISMVFFSIPVALLLGLLIPAIGYYYPNYKISERARKIDTILPTVASYMSAMASSGVPPTEIFASMAEEEIAPEITLEVRRINRDLHILGYDILRAVVEAARRSPSEKFANFLEGIHATITSGGDLQFYLSSETKTLMKMKEEESKAIIEQLGVLSEVFMVLGVVAPLMLIIMVAIMSVMNLGGSADMSLIVLVGLVYIVTPILMVVMLVLVSTIETSE